MADLHEGKDYFNPRLTLNQYTTTIMVAFDNFLKKITALTKLDVSALFITQRVMVNFFTFE